MVEKKKILVILTGGTLSMVEKEGILVTASNAEILRHVPDVKEIASIEVLDLFNVDSANTQIFHWQLLAETISKHINVFDGFVIIHGTDTMIYTASALSFMLTNLCKPIILTGSQKPIGDILSDAKSNLLYAVHMATFNIPEVCIYFDYMLYRGNRTIKASSTQFAAFTSPNFPPLVKAGVNTRVNHKLIRKPAGLFQVFQDFDDRVVTIRIFPGMGIESLNYLCGTDIRGFIIQAFGMGNVPSEEKSLIPFIETATRNGKVVGISSQSSQGMVDLSRYESANHAQEAGALSCMDMTVETSIIKLMFLLGQFSDIEKVRLNFQNSLAGEAGN